MSISSEVFTISIMATLIGPIVSRHYIQMDTKGATESEAHCIIPILNEKRQKEGL